MVGGVRGYTFDLSQIIFLDSDVLSDTHPLNTSLLGWKYMMYGWASVPPPDSSILILLRTQEIDRNRRLDRLGRRRPGARNMPPPWHHVHCGFASTQVKLPQLMFSHDLGLQINWAQLGDNNTYWNRVPVYGNETLVLLWRLLSSLSEPIWIIILVNCYFRNHSTALRSEVCTSACSGNISVFLLGHRNV